MNTPHSPERRLSHQQSRLYKQMLDATIILVRDVAQQEVMPRFLRVQHGSKADGSLFSEADLAAQHYLSERLPKIFSCPIIGEEMTVEEQHAGWNAGLAPDSGLWCIDPIDGTTNFINGLPFFSISVAWIHQGKPRLGVTYNPISDEVFYAREGNGAYLNGRRLPLRKVSADIARGIADVDFKRIPKQLADHIAVAPPFFSQRNFGCSTLEWCNVAAGRLDLYLHGGQMLWDYAAGSLILQEAGGLMCTLEHDDFNSDNVWSRPALAALHPRVFADWKAWVRKHNVPDA